MANILAIRNRLIELLNQSAAEALRSGKLPPVALPEILLERPQNTGHGDYATSLPLKLARVCGKSPLAIGQSLIECMPACPELSGVTLAPPGFINFAIGQPWLASQLKNILIEDENYGDIDIGHGRSVQIEFVSANPTGPLHVGHGRGAVLGSTLANILESANYNVAKEYYINDAGSQMQAFYHSLWVRYQQELGREADMPEGGYLGRYMVDLAKDIISEHGGEYLLIPESQAMVELGKLGLSRMLSKIRQDLAQLNVDFDCWFSEQSLYDNGQFAQVMDILRTKGYLTEKEGATWFVSTSLGEDKDNVVIRSDGTPTYFATDIAYHYNKFTERGFEEVINIWGADHQGHVSRMKAVVGALGIDPSRLRVIISQLVTLHRGGESVRVSKRTGDIITLKDVMDEVGVDACRYFFAARSANSQMDFDLELATRQSADNPVYYIQYAHARIASILRLAQNEGIDFTGGDVTLLHDEPELALIRQMLRLPEVIETATANLEPQHIAYYAQELATTFHAFYKQCRVISKDNWELTTARLRLVAAAKIVLARVLGLMGMTAPDTM